MKNNLTSTYGIRTLVSLFFYIVCCYIAFSETWSTGVMKIFMAGIIASGVLFVYFCGKCATPQPELQNKEIQRFTPAHSNP